MNLKRFRALAVHGFRDFDIAFFQDLTFLTGMNGSGKTTILNATVALITPSLSILAELDYKSIQVDFENSGTASFIRVEKNDLEIRLFSSNSDEPFIFQRAPRDNVDQISAREAEYERDYYRNLSSVNHAVLQFIAALPTPMFLGLDRRAILAGGSSRVPRPWTIRAASERIGRNVFSATLSSSLADATLLSETAYRDVLIATGRLAEELRRDLLLHLLAVQPAEPRGFSLASPSRTEIRQIADMRKDMEALSGILSLPADDVKERVVPFLDVLENLVKQIPANLKVSEVMTPKSPSAETTKIRTALLSWSFNKEQFKKIRRISEMVSSYTNKRKEVSSLVDTYIEIVNEFLSDSGKEVQFSEDGYVSIVFSGAVKYQPIASLSSGESQLFVILTHLVFSPAAKDANVFIIDEPELSLHVQWQELFVDNLRRANPHIQYIMATHSPSIILDRVVNCIDTGLVKALVEPSPVSSARSRGSIKRRRVGM